MAVIDVAIGLIFLYLLLSLLVTVVQEGVASMLGLRSRNLFDAIENLLSDPTLEKHAEYRTLVVAFYRHPLIQGLYKRKHAPGANADAGAVRSGKLPSYIPSRVFATALLDVLRERNAVVSGAQNLWEQAETIVANLPPGELKQTLEALLGDAALVGAGVNEKARAFSARIQEWFNDAMARASGWYRRKAQALSFAIGVSVTIAVNASTFDVAERLWEDSTLRAQVAATAEAYYKEHSANDSRGTQLAAESITAKWSEQMKRLDESALPLGWSKMVPPADVGGWLVLAFGWIVTGVAASLGATFWFDVLGRALQIRGSGPKVSAVTGELQRGKNEPAALPPSQRV
jgi:hypothetical protein